MLELTESSMDSNLEDNQVNCLDLYYSPLHGFVSFLIDDGNIKFP